MKPFTAILLMAAGIARAAESNLVVLDFQSRGISDKRVLGDLRRRVVEVASSLPESGVVPSEEGDSPLTGRIIVPTRCDEACWRRISGKLGAQRLLVPAVERSGGSLRFEFLLVRGSTGEIIRSTSNRSDGRVDYALWDGVSRLLGRAGDEEGIGRGGWTAIGAAGTCLGLALWLGLEQDRTNPTQASASVPGGF
jgi:hypothetical protein